MKQLIDKLRQYSQDLVAYKMGCEFADAVNEAADAIEKLQAESSQLRKERDALLRDLRMASHCYQCRHNWTKCHKNAPAKYPDDCCGAWEWRGVQEGNDV